uniref:Uncharacterized protein n=1 Tax=Roseihalotalea indica TaxID=2867963 RepID=A0AA49GTS3_9BACT|nr:hypothetical protein K4G66_08220 [Tunicatimonas sp. TK19036]
MLPKLKPSVVTRFEREVHGKINHLIHIMSMVEVVNDESDKAVVASAIREAKQLIKQIGAARKAITTPLQEEVKRWVAKEKELVEPIETAIRQADTLIQQYNERVVAQRQAVLHKIAEEERIRLQNDSNAEQIQLESDLKRQVAMAQHSTDGVRKVWTFAVEDLALVPREYLVLDTQKVREAIRNGERHISGIRIYQQHRTVYR